MNGVEIKCPDTEFVLLADEESLRSMVDRSDAVPFVTVLDTKFDPWTRKDSRYEGHFKVALEAILDLYTLISVGVSSGERLWELGDSREGVWRGVPNFACMSVDGMLRTCDYGFERDGMSHWTPGDSVLTDTYCRI